MKENPDFIYICCLFRKYFKAIFNRQEVISHMLSFLRFSVWCNIDLLVLNGMILHKDVNVTASKWVPGSSEVSLVSWAGDLRTGDVQQAEGPQGDVWSEDNEEQDHQLRAEVRWERRQELSWLYIDCSVHISISCQMNFDDYPLDSHACQFQVGSCEYWVVLSLLSLPCSRLRQPGGRQVQLSLHLRRGEAEEPAARHTDRTTTSTLPHSPPPVRSDQTEILHSNFTPQGVYSACGFQVKLQRKQMQFVVQVRHVMATVCPHYHVPCQVYLPSAMFVIVSWVSFLVKPEVVPGR